MFDKKNLTDLKTTILGFIILMASVAYPFFASGPNPWIFGIMICVGIAFIFLPDTLLSSLKKLMNKNSEKKF